MSRQISLAASSYALFRCLLGRRGVFAVALIHVVDTVKPWVSRVLTGVEFYLTSVVHTRS